MAEFEACHSQLGPDFFLPVQPAAFPAAILRYRNQAAAARIGLEHLDEAGFLDHFGRFKPLPGSYDPPLALCYHGHQFGVYNPDLGDGRGFCWPSCARRRPAVCLIWAPRGPAKPPFSRTADGRLTLKKGRCAKFWQPKC